MLGVKRGPRPKELINTKWSSNLAYAIGLLATDGYIARNTSLVDLTSKDREQLVNFNKCIRVDIKIGTKNSRDGRVAFRVQIKNRIFYDFLVSIGFTPAKSKTISEIRIPNQYYFDFLRGCFDGDGCFYSYWDKRWKSSFMFYTEFCSASPKFVEWMQRKNSELLMIKGHVTKAKQGGTYQLKYAKRESLLLLQKMYHGSDLVCLSRKKLKIAKIFDSIGLSVKHISSST